VYERQNKTRVVLNTGKVKLTDRKTASEVIMQPGDLVEVAAHPVRKIVDTRRYTSWKDRTLIFDNTPLSEIAQMIQENYGYTVEIKDKELSDVRFTYTLKDNNLNLLITALSEALELKITEKNKTLTIEKSVSENE
jgi:ferric-dicitrate binding protein FerR (iron transport regulator)